MKILVINLTAGFGGAEKSMAAIAARLHRNGDDVIAVVSNLSVEKEYLRNGIRTETIACGPLKKNLWRMRAYARESVDLMIDRCGPWRPDAVFSNSERGLIFLPELRRRLPNTRIVHCCRTVQISRLLYFINRSVVSRYIGVSSYLLSRMPRQVRSRGVVVYNGFEPAAAFEPPPELSDDGSFRLVIACIPSPWKSLETAVDAVDELTKRGRAVSLTIAVIRGFNDSYLEKILNRIRCRSLTDQITIRENVSDIKALFSSCHAVVSTSVSRKGGPETFGRTVVEAWNAHRLIIASACGGAKELIEHDADGILFPEGSADALAGAIESIMRDRKRYLRLCRAGWEKRWKFDLAEIARRYREVASEPGHESAGGGSS